MIDVRHHVLPLLVDDDVTPSRRGEWTSPALPLILVSNRGPIEHALGPDGAIRTRRGSGGVVTALAGLAQAMPVTWVAAAMTDADRRVAAENAEIHPPSFAPDSQLHLVALPEKVFHAYYHVVSNPLLWFLHHYMLDPVGGPHVDAAARRAWDEGYVAANRAFAEAVRDAAAGLAAPPVVLIQDYQLYLVARLARDLGVPGTFQHFVHIPWPAPGYWTFLPRDMRQSILQGLLANDVVGFQTPRFARNFLATCREFAEGAVVDDADSSVRVAGHLCRVRAYPISVDVGELRRLAESRSVRAYQNALRPLLGQRTIVRVDRLEPSKNVLRGFEAFDHLLEEHPDLVGEVKLLAFLVPSRTRLAEYRRYHDQVFAAINRINGRHERPDWRPIEVFYENNYAQAIAGMSLADVMLVNPIADGMNLVAKEFPIVNARDGVLVLSEGAGAFDQLGDAALDVAPGDVPGTADALHDALTMPRAERVARLRRLRHQIESEDLGWWTRTQLDDLRVFVAPQQRRAMVN